MSFDHLSDFLNVLADRDDLARVSVPVDSVQEVAAITRRVAGNGGGPALLFENVRGSGFPVVTNLLGTDLRLLLAMQADSFEEVADRITAVVRPSLPADWFEALQLVPRFVETAQWPVRVVERAIVQQVVKMGRDVNLAELPILTSWPGEKQPVITGGQVCVQEPSDPAALVATVRRHVSSVPIQIKDRSSCWVHWTPHDCEWQLIDEYRSRGQQMPIAIAIGGDPVLTYVAGTPLPAFVDPLVFAGFLRRQNVEVATARSIALQVPANAEFILEGVIDPNSDFETAPPVAQSNGFYGVTERVPVMQVAALTHRGNPVWQALIPAASASESAVFARASEALFLPLIRLAIPELIGIHRPASGAFRHMAFVSIRKRYPQHARKVMNAVWGLDRLCTTKLVVVVDADVDVQDEQAVWFAVGAQTHLGRDTLFSDGPADMHDHAAPIRGVGSRMGIDATRKLPDEGHSGEWPDSLTADPVTEQLIQDRWLSYGLKPRA